MYEDKILLVGQIHANTEKELERYENSIRNIRKYGYKIMIVDSSSCQKLFNYHELCDYYLYDKENRLFLESLDGVINFHTTDHLTYKLTIPCRHSSHHELNILYQITKSFSLAKTLGYEYVLRLECDIDLLDEDITLFKQTIDECIKTNKKCIHVWNFSQTFWNIDWYFEKFGYIKTQNDWEEFLKKIGTDKYHIELVIDDQLELYSDEVIRIDGLKSSCYKAYRYEETKKYFDSNVIIDFFRNGEKIFFCANNLFLYDFPKKLIVTQHRPGGDLYNHVSDPGIPLYWIFIEDDVEYVELNVEDNIYRVDRKDLLETKNVLEFF